MARSIFNDEEQLLKKRARRRLVGAVVLALTVVVVLPMVLDSEPRSTNPDVAINIPSTDAPQLLPKGETVAKDAPANTSAEGTKPAEQAEATAAAPASSTAPTVADTRPISGMPGSDITTPAGADKDRAKPAEMTPESAHSAAAEATAEVKPKPAESKPAPKSETRTAEREKREAKKTTKAAETKTAESKSSSKSSGGAYVVQVAALSDASKARALEQQMKGAGLRTYTEVVNTQSGAMTRVRAGPYSSRQAAEKARTQLKKAGLDGKVVPK